MAKTRKNKLLIYVLAGIVVFGLLYLVLRKRQEGFATTINKSPSSTSTSLIYETTTTDATDKNVKIKGSDLIGKTIKNFYVEYKGLNGKWIRSAVCGTLSGESADIVGTNQSSGNFDINTSGKADVIFEGTTTRLRSNFYKPAAVSGTKAQYYRDCPPVNPNASTLSRMSQDDTKNNPGDTISTLGTGNILVPYEAKADNSSLIKSSANEDKGLIFRLVRDPATYGGVPTGQSAIKSDTNNRLDKDATPNIRITIEI